jgi:transposase
MVFAKTSAKLRAAMADVLENAYADLTPQMRNLISMLWDEWNLVEQQITALTDDLEKIADGYAGCIRIRQIPGIGPVAATAIVTAIGNGAAFRKGREFAAWLGIVPRQYSTGGKAKMFGTSKRGNVYLRKILIHGARAAVLRIKRDRAPSGAWLDALDSRAPKNVVVVAMANKLARIAWAVLSSGNGYRPAAVPAPPRRLKFPHRSLHGVARTKEQSQRRVRSLVLKMVFYDRPTLKNDTRATHPGQEN